MAEQDTSPVGRTASEAARSRLADPEYRQLHVELAVFERLARSVIARRAELGITQEQLAERMGGTTASAISRIESGQHATTVRTLDKLTRALGGVLEVNMRFDEVFGEDGATRRRTRSASG